MIVPSIHRSGAVVVGDRTRFGRPVHRTDAVRIVLLLALAGTVALLFVVARGAGAGRAAVFPEGTKTGVIALDMSASMSGAVYARVAATLKGIIAANQSVGFVMFSDTAYELLPPNSPPGALQQFIPFFVPLRYYGTTPVFGQAPWDMFMGGTRVGPGLQMAAASLRRAGISHGAILLISDLDDSDADAPMLEQEAVALKQAHITLRLVPLISDPRDTAQIAALFGQRAFVDPRGFRHRATSHSQAIAAPVPWTLLGLGVLLVVLLALNERFNGRLETA